MQEQAERHQEDAKDYEEAVFGDVAHEQVVVELDVMTAKLDELVVCFDEAHAEHDDAKADAEANKLADALGVRSRIEERIRFFESERLLLSAAETLRPGDTVPVNIDELNKVFDSALKKLAVTAISWIIRIWMSMMVMKPMVSLSRATPPGMRRRRKVARAAGRLSAPS